MKIRQARSSLPSVAPAARAGPPRAPPRTGGLIGGGGRGALLLVFWAYWPALHGPFLFDDKLLPFALSDNVAPPLSAWLHGVARPVLMATYWMNARLSGDDT